MTGGALSWLNNKYPGATFSESVDYVCVGGRAVTGRQRRKDEAHWSATACAHVAYSQVVRTLNMWHRWFRSFLSLWGLPVLQSGVLCTHVQAHVLTLARLARLRDGLAASQQATAVTAEFRSQGRTRTEQSWPCPSNLS
jgi:hypothetical protein